MIFPPNRWNKITSFHRPSRIRSAFSRSAAAVTGVYRFGISALLTYFLVRTSHFTSIVPTSYLSKSISEIASLEVRFNDADVSIRCFK